MEGKSVEELRDGIAQACRNYPGAYAMLVEPINAVLRDLGVGLTERTAKQIIKNLGDFHHGDVYIQDCHLAEADHFAADGVKALLGGDLANGAIQLFGAGMNFSSYLSKVSGSKNIDSAEELRRMFKELQEVLT